MGRIARLSRHWGGVVCIVEVTLTLIKTILRGQFPHYITFVSPVKYLWRGEDPYGINFVPGWMPDTAFPYSPSSGLFYFSLFSSFPDRLGVAIYLLSSLLCIMAGHHFLFGKLKKRLGFDFWKSPYRNLYWLMLGSELMAAVLWTKIEIFVVGILLFALGAILEKPRSWIAWGVLGFISQWKFQPLPIVGLAILSALHTPGLWKIVIATAAGFLLSFFLPLTAFSWAAFVTLNAHWLSSLSGIVERNWVTDMQHVYRWLLLAGVPLSLKAAQIIGAVFAVFFVGFHVRWTLWLTEVLSEKEAQGLSFLSAFALGSAYILLFSPMSQPNAYIFFAPLVLFLLVLLERVPKHEAWLGWGALCGGYFFVSLLISDLVPLTWRQFGRVYSAKTLGIMFYLFLVFFLQEKWRFQMTKKSSLT